MGGALTTSRGALTTTATNPDTRRLELQLQIALSKERQDILQVQIEQAKERREKVQLFGMLGQYAKDVTGQQGHIIYDMNSSFYNYADKLRQDVSGTGTNTGMVSMPSGAATTDRNRSFMLTGAGTDGIMTPAKAKAKFEFESDGQWKPVGRKGTIDGKSKIKAAGRASANSNRSNNADTDGKKSTLVCVCVCVCQLPFCASISSCLLSLLSNVIVHVV